MNSILDKNKNREKCQQFTPIDLVVFMLDEVGYKTNLYGKKILEPSFGEGNILLKIVERYIFDAKKNGCTSEEISDGLHNDIVGIELDKKLFNKCKQSLDKLIEQNGIKKVKWSVYNKNFLTWETNERYDYIIGNPPYITYRDIDDNSRKYLRKEFITCKNGKFDYYYAFIEKSINLLNESGRIVQLVPSNIYKNVFANNVRELIKPTIEKIYDFPSKKQFGDVLTTSTIFVCSKGCSSNDITYFNKTDNKSIIIPKKELTAKWIFTSNHSANKGTVRFGDVFNASVTIATLYNKAFIIDSNNKDNIEEEVLWETTSPKFKNYNKKASIIFPYTYKNGKLTRYSEQFFNEHFPNATNHLKNYRKQLDDRCKDPSANWFEYGRSQALAHLNQEKLLISTVITNEIKVYKLGKYVIPYSGIYITIKDNKYSLDDATNILESEHFFNYIVKTGINTNGKSVRISCKDINDYMF